MSDSEVGLVLWTTDIASLARFLTEAGGFVVEETFPGYASLRGANAYIVLHADDDAARGHPWYDALQKEGMARGIGAEIRLRVPSVAAAYRAAIGLGALAIRTPVDVDGQEEATVMGPDGYLFTLWR